MRKAFAIVLCLSIAAPSWAAIARDNTGTISLGLDNPTSGLTYTRAFNCGTGSLRRVYFAYFGSNGGSDVVTGVTYAGVSMTAVASAVRGTGGRWVRMWFLDAPATGSNNFVASLSGNDTIQAWAKCYTGVKQTGTSDAFDTKNTGGATSLTLTVSAVASNCWGISFVREESGSTATWTAGTTSELSAGGGGHIADSNGVVSGTSYTVTFAGSQTMGMVGASFEPDTGGGTPTLAPMRTLLGVGQ